MTSLGYSTLVAQWQRACLVGTGPEFNSWHREKKKKLVAKPNSKYSDTLPEQVSILTPLLV